MAAQQSIDIFCSLFLKMQKIKNSKNSTPNFDKKGNSSFSSAFRNVSNKDGIV